MIAKKYNFQVLPVVLEGGYHAMPSGSWKFRFRNTFNVSILDPIDSDKFEDVQELKVHVQQQIEEELKTIEQQKL